MCYRTFNQHLVEFVVAEKGGGGKRPQKKIQKPQPQTGK